MKLSRKAAEIRTYEKMMTMCKALDASSSRMSIPLEDRAISLIGVAFKLVERESVAVHSETHSPYW